MPFPPPRPSLPLLLFAFVLALFFIFGLHHLTRFVTADEHYWISERVPQYWKAWESGKLKKTFINDKPGVSLALVTGPALLFFPDTEDLCPQDNDQIIRCDVADMERVLFAFRFPLLLMNAFVLVFLFWVLGRLTNPWVALWSTTFTALSPVLLGISQIVNPDALLWSFGAAALFSFMALLRFQEWKYLLWCIFFTSLALLTKYTALFLFAFYALLFLAHASSRLGTHPRQFSGKAVFKYFLGWALLVAGVFAVSGALLPALLINAPSFFRDYLATVPNKPELFLSSAAVAALLLCFLFSVWRGWFAWAGSLVLRLPWIRLVALVFIALFLFIPLARYLFPHWNVFTLPFDLKDLSDARYSIGVPGFFTSFFLEWNPLFFSLPPVLLFALGCYWIRHLFWNRRPFASFLPALGCFLVLFMFLLTQANVLATPRYLVLLFPLLALWGGLGIWEFASWTRISRPSAYAVISLAVIACSLVSFLLIRPFYFDYANALLPKQYLTQDSWGYGGYEAAQYLNSLPGAAELTVWSDYYGFCEFFIGKCVTAYTFDGQVVRPDYYVMSRRGWIRYRSRYTRWERLSGLTAYKYYENAPSDWSLTIGGRPDNFVKVARVAK